MTLKKDLIENNRIIALKDTNNFEKVLACPSKIIFVLCSNICSIEEITREIKANNKLSFIHLEMIQGLNTKDNFALQFLKENSYADGIITTKLQTAKVAKKLGFKVILRSFLIDSISFETTLKYLEEPYFDAVEVMPGVIPKVISKLSSLTKIPIIAGGLISDFDDIDTVLKSGAVAISTTKFELL